ncbi:nuclear transcription factor Y subunit A-7 isoform X2 [Sesamum indicum]|uniref:Nuclear transcription factor Y subunit n=1 Tax=Sesamum indicum TaxID=4182 RepID=A0A8M8V4E8_SESIN|nr:nuclear transcription factor Y subunit A-7 isoform X2 [Sesamum indicum]
MFCLDEFIVDILMETYRCKFPLNSFALSAKNQADPIRLLYCSFLGKINLISCLSALRSIMTSSVHSLSDNSETDEQHKGRDLPASPSYGMSHPGIALPMMHYVASSQLGLGNAQTAYPYPDPYYRSIFAPCDTHPYPSQPYAPRPMLMGIQQAGLPLPSDSVEEPVFVNAKQYHGILRRRQSRAKAGSEHKLAKPRKPYLHESRHLHAMKRARGMGGRFQKKNENQQKDVESSDKSQANFNQN